MPEKKEKAKLLENATLADFVKRYKNISPANAGAGDMTDELAIQMFNYFRHRDDTNVTCSDARGYAEVTARSLYRKYLMINKEEFGGK
jgi:hypothetical protein